MNTTFRKVMKKRWALISALSLFGASVGLFAAVMLLPVGYHASSPILITDGSASTQEVVEAVLESESFQKVYKKKASKTLENVDIVVEQQGIGPLFEISAVSEKKKTARKAVSLTTFILDTKSQDYFGAYSDLKILNKPEISEIPATNDYLGATGLGLIAGFVLGVAISWGLTNSEKDGSMTRSADVPVWTPEETTTPAPTLPDVDTAFVDDVPWTPTTDELMGGIMEPEVTVTPVEEVPEPDMEEPELVPIEEVPAQTPDLEPIEPFSEPSAKEVKGKVASAPTKNETPATDEENSPVLGFGDTPTTKPLHRGGENTMFDHLPEA